MKNTAKIFELAQLAEAAYADFTGFDSSTSASQIETALINPDIKFSPTQAADFADNWRVVHQLTNGVRHH
jgi:hypothetical protein